MKAVIQPTPPPKRSEHQDTPLAPEPAALKRQRGRQIKNAEFYRRHFPDWPYHRLQCQVVEWVEDNLPHLSHLLIAFTGLEKAPARYYQRNGKTHRQAPTVPLLQAEGVRYGVPPLLLAVPRGGYHGLWLGWLKKPRDNRTKVNDMPQPHERPHADALRTQNYCVFYVTDLDSATKLINQYLSLLTL